jgi:hypothetical protein
LKQQNAGILEAGLKNLEAFYSTSSDRDKARVMLNLLKNLEAKSGEKAVFAGASYKQFYTRVMLDAEG